MSKSQRIIVITLIIIIAASIAGLVYLLRPTNTQVSTPNTTKVSITLTEVEQRTGRGGNECWVIVDDTVYAISGFVQWVDGMHTPSGGTARCGKDLTSVIDQSPHGRSKLKYLKEVGEYQR